MQAAGFGRIVNVVSTSVYEPIPNLGVSNTIRGAMGGWAKSLSRELPEGVTINNVLPGFTDTERLSSLADGRARREGSSADQVRANWLAQVPEGRLGRPEEPLLRWPLCSPVAAYIRGVSLPVDGGRLAVFERIQRGVGMNYDIFFSIESDARPRRDPQRSADVPQLLRPGRSGRRAWLRHGLDR